MAAQPLAIITGASTGIGAAIADALAPTHTLLLAGRPSARLDAVAERLGASTWPMDLTDTDSLDEAAELFDEVDVLIHNAGVAYCRLYPASRRKTATRWHKTRRFRPAVSAPVQPLAYAASVYTSMASRCPCPTA